MRSSYGVERQFLVSNKIIDGESRLLRNLELIVWCLVSVVFEETAHKGLNYNSIILSGRY
jgi:hypothetical protein